TKKDLGRIGFHPDANVSYLIFPKRLPKQPEKKVVGIKYDLVDHPEFTGKPAKPKPRRSNSNPNTGPKAVKLYRVNLLRHAKWKTTVEVEAKDKSEAKQRALEQFKPMSMDQATAQVEDK